MAKKKEEVSALSAGGAAPLEAQVAKSPLKLTEAEKVTFDFAINVVKLNRAKAWVNQQATLNGTVAPKGEAYVEAVQARYIALGGLLRGQQLAGKAPNPRNKKNVVNLADEVAE